MCLALFALDAHPHFGLVIAANRDESYARRTAPATWWDEGWVAGRDLAAGGTWFGATRSGRWAFVTNVRDPARIDPSAPSRGALVPAVLGAPAGPTVSLPPIIEGARACNGFNLVAGAGVEALWGSNRGADTHALARGIYGLSNAALDTPWPKVVRTKAALASWCAGDERDVEALFAILRDTAGAPDAELPATGVSLERERLLAAPFIIGESYGTRCSTVFVVTRDGQARFIERSFDSDGAATIERDLRFAVVDFPYAA